MNNFKLKQMHTDIQTLKLKSKSDASFSESDNSKILSLENDIKYCLQSLNDREQYTRCWSVRISGLSVPKYLIDMYGVVIACMKHSYKKIFYPVLLKAVEHGSIPSVPEWQELLENGHFLKTRGDTRNFPPPVIIRFSTRMFRNLFLAFKRGNMPKPTKQERRHGVEYYSVTPDLTSTNFKILKSLRYNQHVEAAWSNDTKLLFRLKKAPEVVHLVTSIHSDTDELINRAMLTIGADIDGPVDVQEESPHETNAGQVLPFTPAITRSQKDRYEKQFGARPKMRDTGGQGSGKAGVRGSGGTGGRGSGGRGSGGRGTGGRGSGETGGRGSGKPGGRGSGGRFRGHRRGWGNTPSTPPPSRSTPDWSTVGRRGRAPYRLQQRSMSPDMNRLPKYSDKNLFDMLSQSDVET